MLVDDTPVRVRGFTLIELLVSMTIIGVLMSLVISAVQLARETARRIQCRDHLRQLSLAVHLFHDSNLALPPLEVADSWATWAVFILPDLEQSNLYSRWDLSKRYYAQNPLGGKDLPLFHCPSRSPSNGSEGTRGLFREGPFSGPPGWTDYGPSGGTSLNRNNGAFGSAIDISTNLPSAQPGSGPSQSLWTVHPGWKLPLAFRDHSPDGLTQTIMFGEMHIPSGRVLDSVFDGDNAAGYQRLLGHDGAWDPLTRQYRAEFSLVDKPAFIGTNWSNRFGSAHSGVCQFSLMDGSVRAISNSVDLEVLDRLARRGDGQQVPEF